MDELGTVAWFLGYGFVGLTGLAVVEKFIPLFPSYVLLMLLGMTVPDPQSLIATIAATTLGSTIGACCWFGIGRTLGGERVARKVGQYGKFIFLSPKLYERLTNAYRRNHFWVTMTGQTIPTARVYLALPAGILGLDFKIFSVATLLGSMLWNAPFLCLGYVLRTSEYDPFRAAFWAAIGLVGVETSIIAIVAIYRRRMSGRSSRQGLPVKQE
jgi:membrane protein DedA with SNARE-associated domain